MTDENRFPGFSEDELRVLLERAVPQLPAPAQRLERVKERARRRRRRRVAGVSATAVVAVAAAGLVLPGLGSTSGAPAPPAVTSLAPPASGSAPTDGVPREPTPTASDATTAPPSGEQAATGYHFAELAGLDLMLPPHWSTIAAPKTGAVFASSQQLGLPPDGCVKPLDGFCTPLVRRLDRGGVLMMMTVEHNTLLAQKYRVGVRPVTPSTVVGACRTVGGTAQTSAVIPDAAGSDVIVQVSVCLARPSDGQQSRIDDALANADFS
jgi:hypothetical protein